MKSMDKLTTQPSAHTSAPIEVTEKTLSLSESLWGSWWPAEAPLICGFTLSRVSFHDFIQFYINYAHELGIEESKDYANLNEINHPARQAFYERVADCLIIKSHISHEPMGLIALHPTDWSSYYLRYIALRPAARGLGLTSKILDHVSLLLKNTDCMRIDTHTLANNISMHKSLLNCGFLNAGVTLSERWGALTAYTKHLNSAGKLSYLKHYSSHIFTHHTQPRRTS